MWHRKLSLAIGACWWLFSTAAAATTVSFKGMQAWRGMDWLSSHSGIIRQRRGGSKIAWAAYELRRSELALQPSNPRLQLEAAEALLKYIRHATNGNFPRVSSGEISKGDDPESRRIWRKHAPEALRLLEASAAYAKTSSCPDDLAKYWCLLAEASTYLSSAKGILRAALQADAVSFKAKVRPLIQEHSTYDSGVGHIFMGTFHLVAPWPVRDLAKAKTHFDAALSVDPGCRRNQYCGGLVALESGDTAQARAYFQEVIKCRKFPEESDLRDFFTSESRAVLKVLDESNSRKESGVFGRVAMVSRLASDW